ncbi:MAG TPA: PAS domain S-box protein, partial [Candidatus Methanoperedens sp.]
MMEKAQNLQQTVKFFEKLLRASADGIVITDSAKNIIFVNEKFCKFFASKIHDVIETNLFIWLEKLDPDARDIWKGLESQTNKNGLANNVEFAMKTTEGMRYFSVNSSLLDKIDIEEEGLIISIWRDDTEHKVAQEALLKAHDDLEMRVIERTEELQESERKYRRLFEYSNDIILQVDSFGKVVAINNKIKETLGFTPEEVIGKYFFKLGILEIKELPGVVKQFKNAFLEGRINPNAGGLLNKLELSLRSKSRELILVETSTTILKKDGKIEGFFTNIRDITHSKHAEEEARLNSEIFKNVSEGIFLLGLEDGLIKHTNSKFEQMFGYEPGEMIGKDVGILNAPNDKTPQGTKEDILGLMRKTGEWHGEVNNIKKDGTLFWSYANVSLFDHPQYGRVIVSVHTDITEQKKAKETLKESEERFRGIFEQSPVAIEIYDQTGHLIDANRKCLDIFGIDDIGEVKNFNLFDDPNLPADVKNRFSNREAIEFESTFNFDLIKKLNLYNTTRSGQCYLDIRILPIWKENKSMSGYLVHVLDITERKKAELEREQFFKFFQISPDMMVIADPDGTFKKVNPATSDLLGYSETELLSKPFVDFVHQDDKQSTLDEIARQIKTGSSLKFENRYVCKDGTLRWLSWRANYNKYEGITYATARDITQSRQADEALHASQEHLHSII